MPFCGMFYNLKALPDPALCCRFLVLYKRTGQPVVINHKGDLVVRPSFIELSMQKRPGGSPRVPQIQKPLMCMLDGMMRCGMRYSNSHPYGALLLGAFMRYILCCLALGMLPCPWHVWYLTCPPS